MGSRIKESPESTFEVYVEVIHPGTTGPDPEVRRRFPEDYIDQETLQTLPKFCFPFSADSLSVSQVGQNFTFVLTDIESKQRFGFCRLSSGAHSCHCILSYLPWFEVFYKLLNTLADYSLKGQDSQLKELLESLHALSIPDPGVPVHLSVHSYFNVPDTRELPSIPENRNLTEYFVAVDVNNMLHLYASMLYERRVLLCCSKLSTLTACVHGAAALLYPMYWQHVYIPVLPQHLIDYCCAPMPYLIGVHSSLMEKVRSMALDEVVVLNVDTNTLETPFDDLQSLPNDVVSSLKNRLKKVSTTTGDGVSRAFLKAQAALFGSYRNALQIEPEEPITFSEELFVAHRSSAMRQFLQNAIQLQLFKQFIDGRLDLLNSGEGFSDVFEDEINMGEYAGSDKMYHQWLLTVKKGGGAIFNTVKTKANPAMKTVYKFAKDHARMGIKEVKSRLKQKELTENGYSAAGEDGQRPMPTRSPSADGKDLRTWDDRRPITVHFEKSAPAPARPPPPRPPPPRLQRGRPARPPRPLVAKRPRSNVALENSPEHYVRPTRHYTVFLSEEDSGDELQHDDDSITGFPENFLFSTPFEWPQPYRSLKESDIMEGEEGFGEERPLGHTAPPSPVREKYSDINLLGDILSYQEGETESQQLSLAKSLEDLRLTKDSEEQQAKFSYQRMDLSGSERTRTLPGLKHSNPYNKLWSQGLDDMAVPGRTSPTWERPLSVPPLEPPEPRPPSVESCGPSQEKQPVDGGCIPIPRPHGRKTPEPGKVLAPPVPLPRASKQAGGAGGELRDSTLSAGGQEFRQALNMSPLSSSTSSSAVQDTDLLKQEVDLLSLLDPLSSGSVSTSSSASKTGEADNIGTTPAPPPRPYPQSLPPFPHVSLNPFAQSGMPYAPHRPYSPVVGTNPFSSAYMSPATGGYFHTSAHTPPHPLSVPSPGTVFRQPSPAGPGLPPHVLGPLRPPAFTRTGPPPSSSSSGALSSLLDSPAAPALRSLPKPLVGGGGDTSADQNPQDPFSDLLAMAKPAVTPTAPPKKRVEDLRRQWETFD